MAKITSSDYSIIDFMHFIYEYGFMLDQLLTVVSEKHDHM